MEHKIPFMLANAAWGEADPGTGQKLPTSGRQADSFLALKIGAGAETNTLGDPERVGLSLCLTAYSVGGGTRAITASTKIDTTPHTVITFTAVDQSIMLTSVPYSGNTNKCRWNVDFNTGTSLS